MPVRIKIIFRYLAGILCKKKRTLKLYDVDSVFVVNQKVEVKENLFRGNGIITEKKDQSEENAIENKLQLVTEFGTTKSRKQLNSMKTNTLNDENISSVNAMQLLIQKKVKEDENLHLKEEALYSTSNENQMLELLPECNLETKEIREVFKIESSKINLLLSYSSQFTRSY